MAEEHPDKANIVTGDMQEGRQPVLVTPIIVPNIHSGRMPVSVTPLTPGGGSAPSVAPAAPVNQSSSESK